MKTIKSLIIALILTTGFTYAASAQTRFHVSVNTPNVRVSAGNYQRGYYRPVAYQRGYYRPVAYRPYYGRPVVYRSYYRRPVYRQVVYRDYYRHDNGRHNGHGKGNGRW